MLLACKMVENLTEKRCAYDYILENRWGSASVRLLCTRHLYAGGDAFAEKDCALAFRAEHRPSPSDAQRLDVAEVLACATWHDHGTAHAVPFVLSDGSRTW